jgi:hypothetical protein
MFDIFFLDKNTTTNNMQLMMKYWAKFIQIPCWIFESDVNFSLVNHEYFSSKYIKQYYWKWKLYENKSLLFGL